MKPALVRILSACVGLALLTSACGGGASGHPTPASTIWTWGGAPTTSSGASGGRTLANLKPCDLLTAGEVTQIGLTNPGEPDRVAGTETCDWRVSGNGGLTVGLNPDHGIKDLDYQGEQTSTTKAGKYQATKVEAHKGAKNICHVVISVTESSSVQLISNLTTSSTDTAAACDRAAKAAELIAPKLP